MATTPVTESAFLRLMLNPIVSGQDVRSGTVLQVLQAEHRYITDGSSLAEAQVSVTTLIGSKQFTGFPLVNLAACTRTVLASFGARSTQAEGRTRQRGSDIVRYQR